MSGVRLIAALMHIRHAARAFLPALAAYLVLAAGVASACPICFSGRVPMLGQKIDAADAVVLATPLGGAGPFLVTASIKGEIAEGTIIVEASPPSPALVVGDWPSLVVRNKSSQQWTVLGSIGAGQATWLREFAAAGPSAGARVTKPWPRTLDSTAEPSDEDWIARLALVAPVLESPDQVVAEIAYGEIARAPYRLLRSLKGTRDPNDVLTWLDDPELVARRPGYTLLLGVTGGVADLPYIDARIDEHLSGHSADNLAALVTASLEIDPHRLGAVAAAFLTGRTRSLPEIEAALLALSVQGTADAAVPRAEIVSVYGAFVRAHPAMAGFVVQDLSDWGAFDVAGDLEAAVRSGALRAPASLYAVKAWLKGAPSRPVVATQGAGGDLPP